MASPHPPQAVSPAPPSSAGGGAAQTPYRPLNVKDALSYLDEVKVQFSSAPEVYNRFLDIMKDFKTQTIDTPGVIDRVSSLFRLHPALIQGFNTFLPPGYRIDFYCPYGADPANGTIYVTTPTGTTASKPGQGTNLSGRFPSGAVEPRPDFPTRVRERLGDDAARQVLEIINTYKADPHSIDIFAMVAPLLAGTPDILDEVRLIVQEVPVPPKAARRPPAPPPQPVSMAQPKARPPPPMPMVDEPPLKKKRTMQNPTPPMPVGANLPSVLYGQPQIPNIGPRTQPSQVQFRKPPSEQSSARFEPARHLPANGTGFAQVQGMQTVIPPPQSGTVVRPKAEPEELAFFDRVSRYIDDKPTYHEFLKLCNLFTQDIIDLPTLVERAHLFLSGSTDLWSQFRDYVGWRDDKDEGRYIDEEGVWHLRNIPIIKEPREEQEQYGPSYRRLPQSEAQLACSGRDKLCWDVLNDQWVSAPTWTSEEGFLATKKNSFEEALQRSEEDRFEYDYHIDAVQRTIALLDPLAARIALMDPEERASFRLKPGLGGQSRSIYPTVLKKIYGASIGLEIIQALHDNPCVAVPIVLARIRQKEEEWRRALRDWKPVWRDIDARNHYKALDYQGALIRATDKKLLLTKTLVAEIETIRQEQQQHALSVRISRGTADDATTSARHQLAFPMPDQSVLFDGLRFVLTALDRTALYSESEKDEIEKLLRDLVQHVFAIPPSIVAASLQPLPEPIVPEAADAESDGAATDAETAASSAPESTTGRGGRRRRDKNALLKQAIDRTSRRRGGPKADSPAPTSVADDDTSVPISELPSTEVNPIAGDSEERAVPTEGGGLDAMEGVETVQGEPAPPESSKATNVDAVDSAAPSTDAAAVEEAVEPIIPLERRLNFFCGSPLFSVVRVLQILHARLYALKTASADIQKSPNKYSVLKVADEMSPYEICLDYCQRLITNDLDVGPFEDLVRAAMGTAGYHVYTIDKVCSALLRMLQHALDPNGADEEKAENLMEMLESHRSRGSGPRSELTYRERVEGALGALGENVYRVEFIRSIDMLVFQLLGKDDLDEDDEETAFNNWEQYIVSFVGQERTEGFEGAVLEPGILPRHLKLAESTSLAGVHACSGLGLKFCLRSLKIFYATGSEDWLFRPRGPVPSNYDSLAERRRTRFGRWVDKRSKEDVAVP